MSGRLLAIGDVHGCAKTLESLIDEVMLMHDDVLVMLGDYIDRADKVFETIELCIQLKQSFPNTVFLMGNHEDMFIRYLKNKCNMDEWRMFRNNGGGSTIRSYIEHLGYYDKQDIEWDDLPQEHKDFYDNLKIYHEIDDYVFVHAGVRPQVHLKDQLTHDMVWIRYEFLHSDLEVLPGKTIVHGHTPMEREELDHYNNTYIDKINLDSACVFGFELTCRDLTNNLVYRRKCLDRMVA